MDMRTALTMGELKRAEVLAGENGLDRKIIAADVMEVPDIKEWFREGLLIISTFYSIKDNPTAQLDTLKSLIQANGAGLIVKVGRYVEQLPEEMFSLANEHDFPLITIPLDLSFVDILSVLYAHLYHEQSEKENQWEQLFQSFMEKELHSVQHFIDEMHQLTHANVYLEDAERRLLATADQAKDRLREDFTLLSQENRKEKLVSMVNPKKQDNDTITLHDRFILPIRENNQFIGFLHILHDQNKTALKLFGEHYIRLKQRLHLIMVKEHYAIEKRFLLEQKELSEESGLQQAYQLVLIDLSTLPFQVDFFSETEVYIHRFWTELYSFVDEHLSGVCFYYQNQELFMYIPHACVPYEDVREVLDQFFSFLNQLVEWPFRGGVSLTHYEKREWDTAAGEAKLALNASQIDQTLAFYEQVGVNRILLRLKDDPDLQHFSKMTVERLREDAKDEELVETLAVYLEENGNNSKTSERLFIHRRTLRYRLEKIEKLLNIDLEDSEIRFLLYLLLKTEKI